MEMSTFFDEFDRRDWEHLDDVDTVRFAVVGLGGFARDFSLPSLAASDYCEATVAVSGSREKAERVADEYEMAHGITYDAYHEGVASDAYDAVYVVTPHALHREYVETAVDLGKAVVCEKSLAATVDDARAIVECIDASDATVMVAYRMQFGPVVRRTRELVDEGFIGDPVHVHGHFSVSMLDDPEQSANAWRLDSDLAGGSALIDLGLYPLNTARYVLDTDATEVYGRTRSPHAAFADVDEHVSCTVALEGGDESEVDAVFTASQQSTVSSRLTFVGSEGQITLEPIFYEGKPQGLTLKRDGLECTFTVEPVDQLVEQFDYFAHCLTADETPAPDARHGLRDMELVDAIYRSAEASEPREV